MPFRIYFIMIKATVDLKKIDFNVGEIKKLIGDKKFCAVVQSNAYGHGKEKVADRLNDKVDYFAVSSIAEGVDLRLSGIDKPVLVLMPDKDIDRALFYNVTTSICSFKQFITVRNVAKRIGKTAYVHIKYDTGMNRFGIQNEKELQAILLNAKISGCVEVTGIYSHLYNPVNEQSAKRQLMKFVLPCKLTKRIFPDAVRHISASGGTLLGKLYHLDMVRIGLMIYGYTPFETSKITLKKCMEINSSVLDVKTLKKNQPFLYGDFKTNFCGKVSLVEGGYADGVRYDFKTAVNRSCMNVFAVNGEKEYTYAILNEEKNADVLAKENGTIPYEILCALTRNAKYEYLV